MFRSALLALGSIFALVATAPAALAQSEAALKQRFEGTTVRVKIDMPASDDGIDVYPRENPTIDWTEHGKRLKRHGTSLRRGDEVLVTKVRVKKDLIEFQLGGGGYGTFGDDTGSDVHVASAPKTQREKNLEQDLKRTSDPAKRRAISEELDALKRERQREDARNEAMVKDAEVAKKDLIRSRAAEAGSRFNLRYEPTVPASALEPEGVTTALRQFLEFDVAADDSRGHGEDGDRGGRDDRPSAAPPRGTAALAKGMTRAQAEAALGAPTSTRAGKEGTLGVERATFTTEDQIVEALFVEGVLVRYTVRSK
jgi:hypothetical protein